MTKQSTSQQPDDESTDPETRSRRYNWSRMDLDELVDVYWQDIAPKRYRDGFDED
ncbi:site-specific integrase, partial [Halorubrum sp. Atlit-8R]